MFRITGECQSLVMKALRSVMKSKAVGMCKKKSIPERNAKRKFTEFNGAGTVGGGCIKAKHLNRFFELKVTAANSTIHPISNAHQ